MAKGKRQNPIKGLFCGIVAGAVASAAMDQYWNLVGNIPGDRPEQKPKKGDNQQKDEPSTQIIADKVSKAVSGKEVPKKDKAAAGVGVHYLTGVTFGALFGIVAALRPRTGLFAGLFYGVLIWLFLDEMMLRALNIAPDPRKVPAEKHVEALGAHLVYGSATAIVAKLLLR